MRQAPGLPETSSASTSGNRKGPAYWERNWIGGSAHRIRQELSVAAGSLVLPPGDELFVLGHSLQQQQAPILMIPVQLSQQVETLGQAACDCGQPLHRAPQQLVALHFPIQGRAPWDLQRQTRLQAGGWEAHCSDHTSTVKDLG